MLNCDDLDRLSLRAEEDNIWPDAANADGEVFHAGIWVASVLPESEMLEHVLEFLPPLVCYSG